MNLGQWGWVAWILTFLTWVVSYFISSLTTAKNEHNKTVDQLWDTIIQCEDRALEYWINADPSIHAYQLNLRLKRITNLAKKLATKKQPFPSELILQLRKSITLMADSDERPVSAHSTRARTIIATSEKLQNYYSKRI